MYDVVVIGGGPGGYAAGIRAAQLGAKAAVVEADLIGGACVNVGCIPTKVWYRAASLMNRVRSADAFGVRASLDGLDLEALRDRKNGVANDIRMGMEALLGNNGVELIKGRAVLKSSGQVAVDDQVLEAGKIILATGGSLDPPDIPGLEDAILTTSQALDLTELPDSLLVLGGGPIETEMACFFHSFGVKVTLAEPGRRTLPREDHDVSQRVTQSLREMGLEILTGYGLSSVSPSGSGFEARLTGAEEKSIVVDRVLIGSRKPNTANLGLENVGIQLNDSGGIQVNERLETSQAGIYAIGDCTGGWMLSHAASAMAITAAQNAMGQTGKFPFNLVPRVVWSMPEVGTVGLSEEEAENEGYDVETGSFPYAINGLAMAHNEMAGEVKVVFEPEFKEILGVHIVGAGATELIGEAVLAMQLECTVSELAKGFRAHPTFSEAMVDSARDAMGWALYLPKR